MFPREPGQAGRIMAQELPQFNIPDGHTRPDELHDTTCPFFFLVGPVDSAGLHRLGPILVLAPAGPGDSYGVRV